MSNLIKDGFFTSLTYTAATPGTRLDPYHVVKISAAKTVDLVTAVDDIAFGISQPIIDDPLDTKYIEAGTNVSGSIADGDPVNVCFFGICTVMAGGTFAAGDQLTFNASGHAIVYAGAGTIIGTALTAGSSGNEALIKFAPERRQVKFFASTEQTGNGSEQSIAHLLGATPDYVWGSLSELTGGTDDLAFGTHTSTAIKVTVSNTVKYFVCAVKL